MTRRTLFASLIGAPVAAALAKDPDVIDSSASKPIVGDMTIPIDGPITTTVCRTTYRYWDGQGNEFESIWPIDFDTKHVDIWVTANDF